MLAKKLLLACAWQMLCPSVVCKTAVFAPAFRLLSDHLLPVEQHASAKLCKSLSTVLLTNHQ